MPRQLIVIATLVGCFSLVAFFWSGRSRFRKPDDVIRLDSNDATAYHNRGIAWVGKGDFDKAITDFTKAIRLDPNYSTAYFNRDNVWANRGGLDKDITDFTEAIRLTPNYTVAYNNLAWLIATCPHSEFRNGPKAVEYANKACELTGWRDARAVSTLAAAYAEVGDFQNALEQQEKAIALLTKDSDQQVMRERLEFYKAGKPYRDMPKK